MSDTRFLLFAAKWSKDSQELVNTVDTFGPHFLGDASITVIEIEKEPELHENSAVRVWPTLIKLVSGKEVERKAGKIDLVALVEFTKET